MIKLSKQTIQEVDLSGLNTMMVSNNNETIDFIYNTPGFQKFINIMKKNLGTNRAWSSQVIFQHIESTVKNFMPGEDDEAINEVAMKLYNKVVGIHESKQSKIILSKKLLNEDNDSEELWMEPMTDSEVDNSYSEPHDEKDTKEEEKKDEDKKVVEESKKNKLKKIIMEAINSEKTITLTPTESTDFVSKLKSSVDGNYGNFIFTVNPNGNLTLALTPIGKEALNEVLENHDLDEKPITDYVVMDEMLDSPTGGIFGNGWANVTDQDIVGLTSAYALAYDPEYNEEGKVINAEGIWAYMDYQVSSMTDELLKNGFIILQSGS